MAPRALEYKALASELVVDESARIIEGVAAGIGNVDNGGDRILAGAFRKTIAERFPKKLIKCLWNHEEWTGPIGMPIEIREDGARLFTRTQLNRTEAADFALEQIRSGGSAHMSIGYIPISKRTVTDGDGREIRELSEIKLLEYSPVIWPMNEAAEITGWKSVRAHAANLKRIMQRLTDGSGRPSAEESIAILDDIAQLATTVKALGLDVPEGLAAAAAPAESEPREGGIAPDLLRRKAAEIHAGLDALRIHAQLNQTWRV